MSTRITSPHAMKNINAVKFTADGRRILVSNSWCSYQTTDPRFAIVDLLILNQLNQFYSLTLSPIVGHLK